MVSQNRSDRAALVHCKLSVNYAMFAASTFSEPSNPGMPYHKYTNAIKTKTLV